mmetsp:Transcript_43970/g.81753  ORF Transcript_43970/g.81753 Transcript_43970/m.81753 type:complete len:96 (+) Transcript_43970:97-384(+)
MRRGATDGKKIVAAAVAGTVAVVGLCQIYLPFIADRDKVRGMFEEEYVPEGAKEQMGSIMRGEQQQGGQQVPVRSDKAGSMWSNMRFSRSGSGGN